MTWLVLTNASPGATRNSGTNGDLCTLLDWALPQAGWAIEYSSGNARVYRPGSGNRFRLNVQHDSAVSGNAGLACVRGCEGASNATTLIDPFPLSSQITNSNSNWIVSTIASTTDRPFRIYLSETFVFYFSQAGGVTDAWGMGFFGDAPAMYDSDSWNTLISVRNTASTNVSNSGIGQTTSSTTNSSNTGLMWVRDVSGAIKSSVGILNTVGASLGGSGIQVARGGYQNRIYREPLYAACNGSTTSSVGPLALIRRGAIPNLWNPLHSGHGTLSEVDTFEDTTYNPSAIFRSLSSATSAAGTFVIMEETDTWSPP